MPEAISTKLNFDSLQLDPNTYVDQQLQEYFADVVYSCTYGIESQLKLAFLFEHKSYIPQRPHLQLLRYMLNIWEQSAKENLPLLPIIPMIIYHGKESWKAKSLSEYFEAEINSELARFIPSFEYLLTNLQEDSKDIIRQRFQLLALQMGFLLMKWVRDEKLLESMEEILLGMEVLHTTEEGRSFLEQVFVYLLIANTLDTEEIMDKARNISHEAGEFANTAGMKLVRMGMEKGMKEGLEKGILEGIKRGIEKGREEGMLEGIEKGKAEGMKNALILTIRRMILMEMDISQIAEIMEVPLKDIKVIEAKLKKEGKLK